MIIVKLMGGLGNQMFQYALGKHLARINKTSLKLDVNFLLDRTPDKSYTPRNYELGIFNIHAEFANERELSLFLKMPKSKNFKNQVRQRLFPRHHVTERQFHFAAEILNTPDNTYLEGYWQSEKYFKGVEKEVREDFSFQHEPPADVTNLSQDIEKNESVCIHVRRGDYVSNPLTNKHHGVCGMDYFDKAISKLLAKIKNPYFYIFSDDTTWCKENFNALKINFLVAEEKYVRRNAGHDLYLMIRCRHFIISNSTFGWWAAWLNQNPEKTIIAPQKWFHDKDVNLNDLYLPGTITL